jgi:hypothetical protein
LLGGILGVVEDLHRCRLETGFELLGDVRRNDQRGQDVAVLDQLDRLAAARDAHGLDHVEQLLRVARGIDLLAPQRDRVRGLGDLVQERDPRLLRAPGQGEADQDRDHDRVEHEQRQEQRRATQDLKVLQEQPAHGDPG